MTTQQPTQYVLAMDGTLEPETAREPDYSRTTVAERPHLFPPQVFTQLAGQTRMKIES